MSKKMAEGIDALVLDVKVGSGAFMKTQAEARKLAETMVNVGKRLGRQVVALLTDMSQPIGRTVGNALEVRESVEVLRGGGPADTRALTLRLAEEMLMLGNVDPAEATRALDDGRALEVFRKVVAAQGGDVAAIDDLDLLPKAPVVEPFLAPQDGYVTSIDAQQVGLAALMLGAGRQQASDAVDPRVGLVLDARVGDRVSKGQPLLWLHHDQAGLDDARRRLTAAYRFGEAPPAQTPLIIDRVR
jgi:thymidine phosphorylase